MSKDIKLTGAAHAICASHLAVVAALDDDTFVRYHEHLQNNADYFQSEEAASLPEEHRQAAEKLLAIFLSLANNRLDTMPSPDEEPPAEAAGDEQTETSAETTPSAKRVAFPKKLAGILRWIPFLRMAAKDAADALG